MKLFQGGPVVIDTEQQDEICILHCKGRLLAGQESEYLRSKLDEIKRLNCSKLVADFQEVPSIGSMGITFIVCLYKSVGGRFVLTGACPLVRHVLELTRLSTVIPLVSDTASGLALLRELGSTARAGEG